MSLTYSTYVTSLLNLVPTTTGDVGFDTMLPNAIDYIEQRAYRELQLLNTVVTDVSTAIATGGRQFNLPSSIGTFVVVNDIYAITPAGQTTANLGTRNSLLPSSREVLDYLYPSSNGSSVPQYFAMTTQNSIIVGPWPDKSYQMEINGTIRPAPLSSTNVTTILSVYFPDLLIAGSMIFVSGYMQNFGASGYVDNAPMAVNWEAQYKELLASAGTEEAMKKFTSQGWSSKQPAAIATPPRT